MVVVLGKWQRPKEFKELVRIKSNKETWRKFDREMDAGKFKIKKSTVSSESLFPASIDSCLFSVS